MGRGVFGCFWELISNASARVGKEKGKGIVCQEQGQKDDEEKFPGLGGAAAPELQKARRQETDP